MRRYIHLLAIYLPFVCALHIQGQSHPKDWHLRHSSADTCYGTGLNNALQNAKETGPFKTVIVAVIDDGVDTEHPDLKENIWVNADEIPGNGIDDDGNGYTDDVNGWDFLGNAIQDIEFDNAELTRLVREYRNRYSKTHDRSSKLSKTERREWHTLEVAYRKKLKDAQKDLKLMTLIKTFKDALLTEITNPDISLEKLEAFKSNNFEAELGADLISSICRKEKLRPLEVFTIAEEEYRQTYEVVKYHLNPEFDPRPIIGDNYTDAGDKAYGNAEVKGPDGKHGSHVAGIIAAIRQNGIGVDGMSEHVKIMALRAVPNGDERDKDIALAIRYAADNGASIINMSFGKSYAYNAGLVQDAIRYAESKDVLMVHAAGNDHQNNDKAKRYPSDVYSKSVICKTWIEVGASDRNRQPADFSNYGRKTVHVFAPGVQIYSTVTDSSYQFYDGTSMASPVVAGLAALLRSRYPHLSAVQVKAVIENSVEKPNIRVVKPGKKQKKTRYRKLCTSGGIVHAENALRAAASLR